MGRELRERRERLAAALLERAADREVPEMRPGRPEALFARICERLEREAPGSRGEGRRILSARRGWRRVAVVTATCLLLFLLTAGGAFAFSCDASPDSSLYGTKLFFERMRLTLTPGAEGKVSYRLHLTDKRMSELERMIAAGKEEGGQAWESAYRREVEGLLDQVSGMPEANRERLREEAMERLREQARHMEHLAPRSGEYLGRHVRSAYEFCNEAERCMRERCEWGGNGGGHGHQDGGVEEPGGGGGMHEGGGNGGGGPGYHGGRSER